jgi:outer membrane protein OmpA-like peptidoglycan-associated protein
MNYLFIGAIWFLSVVMLRAQDKQSNLIVHTEVFYFNSGKSDLLSRHQQKIVKIVKVLQENEAAKVSIAAHTDSVGTAEANESLAEARANSILEALVAQKIQREKLNVISYGEYAPSARNETAEGRAENRRVTVKIWKPSKSKEIVVSKVPEYWVQGEVRDQYSKNVLPNTMVIAYRMGEQDTVYTDSKGRYQIPFLEKETVLIEARKVKFFFQTKQTSLVAKKVAIINFELVPAIIGNKMPLGGLYFKGGTSLLLPSSKQALLALLEFLKMNKDLRIELGGHVNVPNQAPVLENSSDFILSEARARTVFNYLVEEGIVENRIVYKGYGNWQMLYPKATDLNKQQANRRVELKIIE